MRLLAATHRDMEALVQAGRFREDLWYRVSVFPLYLPPLRARRDDVRALGEHFARSSGVRLGVGALEMSASDLALLQSYPWPGNVRELAGVVERAAILGGGHRLDVRGAMETKLHVLQERLAELPGRRCRLRRAGRAGTLRVRFARRGHAPPHRSGARAVPGAGRGGRRSGALLGVNPHTLRGRMRRLGIESRAFRP